MVKHYRILVILTTPILSDWDTVNFTKCYPLTLILEHHILIAWL